MTSTISPADFAATNFDYLIIGGGTAGLTLATRLSENPQVNIGVIEAGVDHSEDPNVLTPGLKMNMWGDTRYDWVFKTTPQNDANSRVIAQPQGKQLGGSSAINFLYWTRASQQDIDDWGALGNLGWSWGELLPYFLKSEHYNAPPTSISSAIDTSFIDTTLHGEHGPVQNGFGPYLDHFYTSWESTYKHLGLSSNGDPFGGTAIGSYSTPLSLDPKNASRSYAANAYYKPAAARRNLKIMTDALVTKIEFVPSKKPLVATGVAFSTKGKTYTAKAKREIILCAGVFQSPKLLELSGIGDRAILERYEIQIHHHNPNVGENLQDHLLVPLSFEAAKGEQTSESLRNTSYLADQLIEYSKNHTGMLATGPPSAFVSFSQVEHALNEDASTQGILSRTQNSSKVQDVLTLAKLFSPNEAFAQELYAPGSVVSMNSFNASLPLHHYFTMLGVLEHPFSRGNVHIASTSANDHPIIDPKYLSHPLDLYLIEKIMLHLQQVARTVPLSDHLLSNGYSYQPGFHELNASNVGQFVRNFSSTENHAIGTCAMGPENQGGVVDETLRVHGTHNLRVADASVFPLLTRGNLQSLVYAVAERASDFIKENTK